ncbi:hypothetical protein OG21DRAFT_1484698 [Imleria badia]|nr:hypothetical protein OG21DRAFT_1484698 [Imleria badia]
MLFKQDSWEADAHAKLTGEHEPKLSHELIAGAASYEAAKAYENHLRTQGKPANHAKALELLAGFTGAFVDRFAETKGLDALDRERAKHDAKKHAQTALDNSGQY